MNSKTNLKKRVKNEEMKTLMMPPKREPRDDDKALVETVTKRRKSGNSCDNDKNEELQNGVVNVTRTFSDEENDYTVKPIAEQGTKPLLKKEELTDIKMLDESEEMLDENEDPICNNSSERFSFNLNDNDQLQNDFLEDENIDNPLAEDESNSINDNETNEKNTNDSEGGDGSECDYFGDTIDEDGIFAGDDKNEESENSHNTENDNSSEERENNTEDGTECDNVKTVRENSRLPEIEEDNEIKSNNDVDKDTASEIFENKRPSSRESTTSTTSNSSERTLTIRSASDLNKMVVNTQETAVKKEKTIQDYSSEDQLHEKPHGGLSILNPSQLGASDAGGENLLQNMNFTQSNNQMSSMGFIGSNVSNNVVPLQCDVCETQFPDSLTLEDHRLNAGHFKCLLSPECAALVFRSVNELTAHQQSVHSILSQSPVQQLAHQVQTLPIRYQMEQPLNGNFSMSQYPTTPPQPRPTIPQVYPPAQNMQLRGYIQSSPRINIGSVRGNFPMPPHQLKRTSNVLPQPRMTPIKRTRMDYSNRNGDADCKVVSIQKPDNTDDVVAQLSKSITITARQESQKKNEAAAVTNLLANRGITVSSVPPKQTRSTNPVAMLNLNSAVSLIPTNNSGNRQNRSSTRQAVPLNQSRMQTVDLTGPDPPRMPQIIRANRFQCQICDRTFFNQDQLNQHMITHRNTTRNVARKQLPFKCNLCTAQYPTQEGLQQHKRTFHRDSVSTTNEMVIPIVDLKQPGSLQKLNAIGIHHMIPLNALGSQSANGTFGIPVLPLSSDRNTINNLGNCAISNILPIGPLKTLGR